MAWDLDNDSGNSSIDEFDGAPARTKSPSVAPPTLSRSKVAEHATPSKISSARTSSAESSVQPDPGPSPELNPRPQKRRRLDTSVTEPRQIGLDGDNSTDSSDFLEQTRVHKAKSGKNSAKCPSTVHRENQSSSKRPGKSTGGGVVGKSVASSKKTKPKKQRTFGDESDDDALMEWTVPDYLRERRDRFDSRVEKLREGGLRLPPNYDDVDFSDDDRLQHLGERPAFTSIHPCAKYKDIQLPRSLGLIPASIAQWLRDYQVQGVEFLHWLFVFQRGGILGDDMGLGKTIQVIAFLTAAYGKTADERDVKRMRKMRRQAEQSKIQIWYPRTLIICPGTLIENWKKEFRRWGWWHVDVYHGSVAAREAALQATKSGRTEVLVTTYSTYRLNKGQINLVKWDCVVADECHMFKERASDTAKSMNDVNALCRIGLTGTAIQNKYEELWTLLNWTNPGQLGPVSTWKHSICEPLKLGQSHSATEYQLGRARKTAQKLVENLLPQFFLRRMKTLIKDQLPKKSDRVVFCPLTETQAEAYENFLDSDVVQFIKYSAERCDCGSGKKRGWCCYTHVGSRGRWQNYVFPAIFNLQKLSNHLANLIPRGTDQKEKQSKDLEMLEIALPDQWKDLYKDRDNIMHYANPEFCGKWRILKKLLKFWSDAGDKVLIFSHSVRLLKMLQVLFNHTSYNVSYLDGAMSYEDRAKTVDDFNSDPLQFAFLISTRAGGVGLNITSANKVVVFDPNWNPSYDLQAQDRAYRIGQVRDVEVFRLVSAGTIEEIVYARQIYKQQQANIGYNASHERRYFQGVQGNKDQKGEIFGLSNLFEYQNENIVLRDIVNKTNIAESRAGVSITGIDIEDDSDAGEQENSDSASGAAHKSSAEIEDSQDAAMSQLAALITSQESSSGKSSKSVKAPSFLEATKPNKPKNDPVPAILSSAGVQYTHENSEVIGSSKVEARLSRRAARAGSNLDLDAQVFLPESQSRAINNSGPRYKYRPSEMVKKRQFCSMAKWAGEESTVAFGAKVEAWTQAERREFLESFYEWRREALGGRPNDIGALAEEEPKPQHSRDSQNASGKFVGDDVQVKPAAEPNTQRSHGFGNRVQDSTNVYKSDDGDEDEDDEL
ncbi:MAG: hypothetical protein Q9227_000081 [Pyrenula ochraceoflavens]